ncbi:MAG: BON domain-containing protein [Chloroflexota bacterium]|nr:BON domain-containing protein [Dehalococcoidia bacterium]MDW8254729.1 BON domain-containing protein [Chloroflexota bacterium]
MLPEPHRYRVANRLNTSRDVGIIWRINQALARDPRTAGHQIEITAVEDRIRLLGTVPSPEVRDAALEIVRSLPGIAAVIDDIRVVRRH